METKYLKNKATGVVWQYTDMTEYDRLLATGEFEAATEADARNMTNDNQAAMNNSAQNNMTNAAAGMAAPTNFYDNQTQTGAAPTAAATAPQAMSNVEFASELGADPQEYKSDSKSRSSESKKSSK